MGESSAQLARRHIPQPGGVVRAGGGEGLPVRAERDPKYKALMGESGARLARRHIPQPGGVVVAGGGEGLPVRAERDRNHLTLMERVARAWPVATSHSRAVLS